MPSVRHHVTEKIKYQYVVRRRRWLNLYYALAAVIWASVIVGYIKFLQVDLYLLIIFILPILVKVSYHSISYFVAAIGYKNFDLDEHKSLLRSQKDSLDAKKAPTVDVYIPTAGEDVAVIKHTVKAAQKLDYPVNKFKIYILDDGGSDEVKALASARGIEYIRRPNLGEDKKAGNLKYALSKTKGDYYVVFDADFVPHASFLKETMPYMLADDKISIVQTPQYFERTERVRRKSGIEFGAALIQEVFYQVIMPARDNLGGAICVGTNALYRRSAVMEVGGPVLVQHSEDVNMGLELNKVGYTIKFIPLILAIGLAPSDIYTYYRQQHRWATGATLMLTQRKLLTAPISLRMKLLYLSGILYYFNNLSTFLMPLQFYFLIAFHYDTLNIAYALYFLPSILFIITQLWIVRGQRPTLALYKTVSITIYAHSQAIVSALRGKIIPWTPTNNRSIAVSREFIALHYVSAVYMLLCLLFVVYAIVTNRLLPLEWRTVNVWFWLAFSLLLIHLTYFVQSFNYIHGQYLKSYVDGLAHRHELARMRTRILYAPAAIIALFLAGGAFLYQSPATTFELDKQARGENIPASYTVDIKSAQDKYNSVTVQAVRPLTQEMGIKLTQNQETYAALSVYYGLKNTQPGESNKVEAAEVYKAVIESQRVNDEVLSVIEASREADTNTVVQADENNYPKQSLGAETDKPKQDDVSSEKPIKAVAQIEPIVVAVSEGDNQTKITRTVLHAYAKERDIEISEQYIRSIEDQVINSIGRRNIIHPGETLSFDSELLSQYIQPRAATLAK